MFQSTHPRGVRRSLVDNLDESVGVSIHAPTRGATYTKGATTGLRKFQSTHPRGVRRLSNSKFFRIVKFQSTHPRGVRPYYQANMVKAVYVSIHAPTRGATQIVISDFTFYVFQSTHPRGVRPYQKKSPTMLPCFNPRTHEGCDT